MYKAFEIRIKSQCIGDLYCKSETFRCCRSRNRTGCWKINIGTRRHSFGGVEQGRSTGVGRCVGHLFRNHAFVHRNENPILAVSPP